MNVVDFQAVRPFLVYLVGMVSDYLVARGWLLPEQRQLWVQGWVDIISSAGGVVLTIVFLTHESKLLLAKTNLKNPQPKIQTKVDTTVTTSQQQPDPTVTVSPVHTGLPIQPIEPNEQQSVSVL